MNTRVFRSTILFLAGGACCLLWTCRGLAAEPAPAKLSTDAKALLKTLDPFYKQHVEVDGMLILGSEKVSRYALDEVAYLVRKMLANRPDVLKRFAVRKKCISVMAYTEMQTDLPDCRGLDPWWDYRARGVAGSVISCGEENVLSFKGDPWEGENIFVHEFAHGIHGMIGGMDKQFNARLVALHAKAEKSGLFRGYGIEGGAGEFWAEGVQAWFNCNGTIRPKSGGGQSSLEVLGPKGKHVCHMTTREQVKSHLPGLAKLLDESFRQNEWVYVPVAKRLDQPHLRGFDPAKAPTFRWPPGVIEAFYAREDLKKVQAATRWARITTTQVAAAKALGVPVVFENSVGMRFVLIPPGTFMMGSKDSPAQVVRHCAMPNVQAGWFHDEHPRHKVTLTKAFYMAIHEVTQGAYEAVTQPKDGKGKGKRKGKKTTKEYPAEYKGANKPIANVSWSHGEQFCKTLSTRDGRKYALPTEAQWEYACRAGTDTPFSFGQTVSTRQANYHGGYTYGKGPKAKGKARRKPLPVGSLRHNAWGLYDMHGNVSEWCADRYGPYGSAAESDPKGPADGREHVLRGGSWRSYPGACRSAFRSRDEASTYHVGFRVTCAVSTESADKK